jgi:hypothetical protein
LSLRGLKLTASAESSLGSHHHRSDNRVKNSLGWTERMQEITNAKTNDILLTKV